ncbi:hypothetical protein [Streptomyces murinus]
MLRLYDPGEAEATPAARFAALDESRRELAVPEQCLALSPA